jgi:hypothetical protein
MTPRIKIVPPCISVKIEAAGDHSFTFLTRKYRKIITTGALSKPTGFKNRLKGGVIYRGAIQKNPN